MLIQHRNRSSPTEHPGKADPQLVKDYPYFCQFMDAVFAAQAAIISWLKRRRTRQQLAVLDNHQLRDIGLTRADVSGWNGRLCTMPAKRSDMARVCGAESKTRRWLPGGDTSRRALADLDDSQLSSLSETGLRLRREARRASYRD